MSNAYPWHDQLRNFTARKQIGDLLHLYVGRSLNIVALLFSVTMPIMWAYTYYGFERSNDTWWKRGLILFGVGAPVTGIIALINPFWLIEGPWNAVQAVAFDHTNPTGAIIQWQVVGIFPALALAGIAAMGTSYDFEFSSEKYLRPIKHFGVLFELRRRKNRDALASGASPAKGWVAFGLHEKDTLAWRSRRYGMVIGRPFDKDFGHGLVVGSNGSGKTVGGLNVFDMAIENGASGIYPDFKGSRKVEAALRDIALRHGRPFYSFDIYDNAFGDNAYYDPLDWPGLPTDKANVILNAMPFAEGGGAQHYRNIIEAYLPIQVEVMEYVGRAPGEGSFDFLFSTCDPAELKRRAAPFAQSSDPRHTAKYQEWVAKLTGFQSATLDGLRANLGKIINSGGKYLRPPQVPGARVINLRAAAEEGAIVYFSLTTSLDTTSVVTIGSLLIQDVTALIGSRVNDPQARKRPLLFMPDETSVLEERAALLDNAFRQAREAEVWVWPIAQSLAAWPESTRAEVLSNARTKVVYNVPDEITQKYLVGGLSKVPVLIAQVGQDAEDRFGGRTERTVTGKGFAKVDKGDQLTTGDLNLADRKAWVWFSGGNSRMLTIKTFRRHRVRHEEIEQDIVMVDTIARTAILDAMNGAGDEDLSRQRAAQQAIEVAVQRQADREQHVLTPEAAAQEWAAVNPEIAATVPVLPLPQAPAQETPTMPRFPTGRGSGVTPVFRSAPAAPPAPPGPQAAQAPLPVFPGVPTPEPVTLPAAGGPMPSFPVGPDAPTAPVPVPPLSSTTAPPPTVPAIPTVPVVSLSEALTPEQAAMLQARRQQQASLGEAARAVEQAGSAPEAQMTLTERLALIKRNREAAAAGEAASPTATPTMSAPEGAAPQGVPVMPVFPTDEERAS